jgi:hypothetical protein
MQGTLHLTHGRPKVVAACTPSYISLDVAEDGDSNGLLDLHVFVNADSALQIARAAVEAYNHLVNTHGEDGPSIEDGPIYLGEYVVPDVLPPEPEFTEIPDGDLRLRAQLRDGAA